MIHINLQLQNPFNSRWNTIAYGDRMLSKNTACEYQVIADNSIIGLGIRYTARCDHAGLSVEFSLLGYTVLVSYHDTRHWNEEKNRYFVYDSNGKAS